MRARWLKPEFFTDKKMAEMGPVAALVFQALWVIADDGGTAKSDPETLKSQVFYRWSAVTVPGVSTAFLELARSGRIIRYRVGDDEYVKIVNWDRHQNVHKPGKFRHPSLEKGVRIDANEEAEPHTSQHVPGNSAAPSPDTVRNVSPDSAAPSTPTGTSAAPLPASPPPRLLDSKIKASSSSSAREAAVALARRLTADPARTALERILARANDAESCAMALTSMLDGQDPAVRDRPSQPVFEHALFDYAANGERWNAAYFRAHLTRASQATQGTNGERSEAAVHPKNTANGRRDPVGTNGGVNGRAALVLNEIRELVESHQQPGQAMTRFIRRADVERLGADVLAAYDAIGGAERVIGATGEQVSFLTRDFAAALAAAERQPTAEEASHVEA